jgi:hypothetical protein
MVTKVGNVVNSGMDAVGQLLVRGTAIEVDPYSVGLGRYESLDSQRPRSPFLGERIYGCIDSSNTQFDIIVHEVNVSEVLETD